MATTANGTPYVVSSDTITSYPTTSLALANSIDTQLAAKLKGVVASTAPTSPAAGDAWIDSSEKRTKFYTGSAWVPVGGKILQVVSAVYSTQTSSNTTTWADTGLTASITPTSTSSKVLVLVSQNGMFKGTADGTGIGVRLLRGSTVLVTPAVYGAYVTSQLASSAASVSYLDSPGSLSAVTYKTQFNNALPSGWVDVQRDGASSTIVLMEVGA